MTQVGFDIPPQLKSYIVSGNACYINQEQKSLQQLQDLNRQMFLSCLKTTSS